MYTPPYNVADDRAERIAFMRANNFCLLVTASGGEPGGSHLPCIVEERGDEIALTLHMARANPQWQSFWGGDDGEDVMLVFTGPHAYVSPRWYADSQRVPTWNYAAIHAYGKVHVFEEQEAKHRAVEKLVAAHDPEWMPAFNRLDAAYLSDMLAGIVAFEIRVSRIETRWKLSQNRGRAEQELIVAQLERSGDASARLLAELTRRHYV